MRLDRFNNSAYRRGVPWPVEALWYLVKCLFFLSPVPYPSFFKVLLLRLFGAKVGGGVVIRPRVNITMPWRLEVGDWVWIGEGCTLLLLERIVIGSHVCLSQESYLCTGSHDYRSEAFDLVTRKIVVEDGVWVGARAFVCPGVHLPSGVIIGAASVVTHSPSQPGLHAGNPARPVRRSSQGPD